MSEQIDKLTLAGDNTQGVWINANKNEIGKIILTRDLLDDYVLIVIHENTKTNRSRMTTTVGSGSRDSLIDQANQVIQRWLKAGYNPIKTK